MNINEEEKMLVDGLRLNDFEDTSETLSFLSGYY